MFESTYSAQSAAKPAKCHPCFCFGLNPLTSTGIGQKYFVSSRMVPREMTYWYTTRSSFIYAHPINAPLFCVVNDSGGNSGKSPWFTVFRGPSQIDLVISRIAAKRHYGWENNQCALFGQLLRDLVTRKLSWRKRPHLGGWNNGWNPSPFRGISHFTAQSAETEASSHCLRHVSMYLLMFSLIFHNHCLLICHCITKISFLSSFVFSHEFFSCMRLMWRCTTGEGGGGGWQLGGM